MRQWCSSAMSDFKLRRAQKELYLFGQDDDPMAHVTLSMTCHFHPPASANTHQHATWRYILELESLASNRKAFHTKPSSLHLHLDILLSPLH